MKNYTHFCLYERQRIERYLREGKSRQFIADKLDRSKSSVSDEIKQNSVAGVYNAKKAHHKAYAKRKYSKIQSLKVVKCFKLWNFVETNIKDDQSPEAISGRLKNVEKIFRLLALRQSTNLFTASTADKLSVICITMPSREKVGQNEENLF